MRKFNFAINLLILIFLAACTPSADQPAQSEMPPTGTETALPTGTLAPEPTPTPSKVDYYEFFEKPSHDSIRVLSYNINWDSIFPVGDPQSHDYRTFTKPNAFVRVIQAIQPDIVCLQEINPIRDPQQLSDILNEAFEDEGDQNWQAMIARDNVIATHFDLEVEGYEMGINSVIPNLPQAAALVNLPDEQYGPLDFYVFCAHFKASGTVSDILMRSRQADVIMSHVRDITTPGENLDLPEGTPILILGDFNVYDTDPAEHLTTLLTGDLRNEDRFGADFAPDWDGTDLTDALPSQNGLGEDFNTWRDDQSPFENNILDRIIYTDSALQVENAFILNTMLLSEEGLALYGLHEEDVVLNATTGYYDHFPLVVDFVIVPTE
jgi:endonuclease/exonuclease/phosphatase family metal-dependent hydrolase